MGLVGDDEAEGPARKGRATFSGEEEDDAVAQIFNETVLSGKFRQAVCRATDREGGGCLLPDEQCNKTGRLVSEVLREKHLDMRVPPVEKTTCAAFEEYENMPETVPLDFTENDVTWVASKFLAQQVRWEQRRWSCVFGPFALDVRPRPSGLSSPAWQTGWLNPPSPGPLIAH